MKNRLEDKNQLFPCLDIEGWRTDDWVSKLRVQGCGLRWDNQDRRNPPLSQLTLFWGHSRALNVQLEEILQIFPGLDYYRQVWKCICLMQNSILFCKYLNTLILNRNCSVFISCIYGSQFSGEKNLFAISSLKKIRGPINFRMP